MDSISEVLEKARLRYVTDTTPGLTRQRQGESFVYLNAKGQPVEDENLLKWIAGLGIPPAWEQVWIAPYKNAHILATGRDARGRKQYRYHPRWQELRGETKFDRMAEFAEALPLIRQVTAENLRKRTLTKEKVLAAVVTLLERTLIRIGNAEYARHNETYGLTTLQDDHVSVERDLVQFDFIGKSGKEHSVELHDRRLAAVVRACQELPGQHLFQYDDGSGLPQMVGSSDVNQYLYAITGQDFSAKTFRTWGASTRALRLLAELPSAESDKEAERQIREVIKQVSGELGNTTTICRKYYVHPLILEAHQQGRLPGLLAAQPPQEGLYSLAPEESAFVALIREKAAATM